MTTIDSAITHLMAEELWDIQWDSPVSDKYPSTRVDALNFIASMSVKDIQEFDITQIDDSAPLYHLVRELSKFPEGILFPDFGVTLKFINPC